jgi:phage recombination protein Bet
MTSLILRSPASTGVYFTEEQCKSLRDSIFPKELSNADFEVFKYVCARTGLDPFMKQIHASPRKEWNVDKPKMVLITAIDGHRLIAERTGKYAPGKATEYTYDKDGKLFSATAFIKKMTVDGTWHEVSETCLYSEYCQTKKDGSPTEMWRKMGHVMLGKCAKVAALRAAFPAEMSGLYAKEEMDQATNVTDLQNTLVEEVYKEIEIISVNKEQEVLDFISSWGSDSTDFEAFFDAGRKAYKTKSDIDIVNMLKADLDGTNVKFETWKARRAEKAQRILDDQKVA